MRDGRWKLVRRWGEPWELDDVQHDPAELADLAAGNPDLVDRLATAWQQWADRVGVIDFSVTQRLYRDRGLGERDAIG